MANTWEYALSKAWRPNCSSSSPGPGDCSTEDREEIRKILEIPATNQGLTDLTRRMNELASFTPATVKSIQTDLDEAIALEAAHSGSIGTPDGKVLSSYEGARYIRDGADLGQAPKSTVDVIKYDTELLKEKIQYAAGGDTVSQRGSRYNVLVGRIRQAILGTKSSSNGETLLLRS